MRRITLAIVSTLAALVLLFSYRTSLGDPGPGGTAARPASEARVLDPGAPATTASTAASTGGSGDDPDQITAPDTRSDTTSTDPTPAPGGTAAPPPTPPAASTAPTTPTTADAQTVQGAEEMTRYGAVQVVVTISGGSISDVQAVQYPDRERRDQEINSVAIPELRNQVLSAQSANVAGVSGATYTTQGYLASVQSALDAAGFIP